MREGIEDEKAKPEERLSEEEREKVKSEEAKLLRLSDEVRDLLGMRVTKEGRLTRKSLTYDEALDITSKPTYLQWLVAKRGKELSKAEELITPDFEIKRQERERTGAEKWLQMDPEEVKKEISKTEIVQALMTGRHGYSPDFSARQMADTTENRESADRWLMQDMHEEEIKRKY